MPNTNPDRFETIPGLGRINCRTLELEIEPTTNYQHARKEAQKIANACLGTVTIRAYSTILNYVEPTTLVGVRI